MKYFYNGMLILLSFIMITAGCKDNGTEPENGTAKLVEIDDVLPNPFKGFAPWIGTGNPEYQTKLQEATFGWADLEPAKGDYKWSVLEKNWGNVSSTGKRVGFRVAAEIPGSGKNDTPQWLIDQGVEMRPYSIDGQTGLAPDWDDSLFLAAHRDFIMALGARYDQDPRVAWIDIGSYGFWGEWHVWMNPSLAGKQSSKQAILEAYFDAFPTKKKVIAFDDDFATQYVVNHGGGIRNDCLGTEDSNNWYLESLNSMDPTMNDRVWRSAIITGEFCGGEYGAIEGTTERFELNYAFIQQTHWSWIGPAGGAIKAESEEHRQNLDKLHKKLGYRFVLKSVDHAASVTKGNELEVTINLENKGVAPFYYEWPLALYLINDAQEVIWQTELAVDIRDWLPGLRTSLTTVTIPDNIASGSFDVKLAILDPDKGKPGVMFANKERDDAGRYKVSRLTVN